MCCCTHTQNYIHIVKCFIVRSACFALELFLTQLAFPEHKAVIHSHSVARMKHFPKFGDQVIMHWTYLIYCIVCFIMEEKQFCDMRCVKNGLASISSLDRYISVVGLWTITIRIIITRNIYISWSVTSAHLWILLWAQIYGTFWYKFVLYICW